MPHLRTPLAVDTPFPPHPPDTLTLGQLQDALTCPPLPLPPFQILSWWKMRWKPLGLGNSNGSCLFSPAWHGQVFLGAGTPPFRLQEALTEAAPRVSMICEAGPSSLHREPWRESVGVRRRDPGGHEGPSMGLSWGMLATVLRRSGGAPGSSSGSQSSGCDVTLEKHAQIKG